MIDRCFDSSILHAVSGNIKVWKNQIFWTIAQGRHKEFTPVSSHCNIFELFSRAFYFRRQNFSISFSKVSNVEGGREVGARQDLGHYTRVAYN